MLGPCTVFDTQDCTCDAVTLPSGAMHHGSNCPVDAAVGPGGALVWTSDVNTQGSVGSWDNGCAAKDTCGLLYSVNDLGGGWQICFE
eukprot:COSAG06_NODE_772_length_12432_cov_119.880159_9_plen_87_part_00